MKKTGFTEYYKKANVRFFILYTLLSNAAPGKDSAGVPTIAEISEKTGIPRYILRKDMYKIITSKYLFKSASIIDYSDLEEPLHLFTECLRAEKPIDCYKDFLPFKKNLLKDFVEGKYDHTFFCLDFINFNHLAYLDEQFFLDYSANDHSTDINHEDIEDDSFEQEDGLFSDKRYAALPLSSPERYALTIFMPELDTSRHIEKKLSVQVKSIDYKFTEEYTKTLIVLKEAINKHKVVFIEYIKMDNTRALYKIHPVRILVNYYDQLIHVLCKWGRIYNIRQIKSIRLSAEIFSSNESEIWTDCLWGSGFKRNEKPMNIKLKVVDNTPNLTAKLLADTANRKYGHYDPETRIYTDRILGESGFRRWLRGYGSSIVVLEPEELAEKMKKSARKQLKVYEKGSFV